MAPPLPPLMEELVEEILLRFPPGDPALLIRAALVCKQWCRLVSGAGFRRRFREFHRTAPVLGFICNLVQAGRGCSADTTVRFVPATSSSPRYYPPFCAGHRAVDARHGHVLLRTVPPLAQDAFDLFLSTISPCEFHFVVWDLVTDKQREVPLLRVGWASFETSDIWTAAVLCAAARGGACDHHDCHLGHFNIVFVDFVLEHLSVYIYSSEFEAWTTVISGHHLGPASWSGLASMGPSLLIGDALHFVVHGGRRILTYNLGSHGISVIATPCPDADVGDLYLMTSENGGLGVAGVDGYTLNPTLRMWSRKESPNGQGLGYWENGRVIELKWMMLSIGISYPAWNKFDVVGFAKGTDTNFISTYYDIFAIELTSRRARRVCDRGPFYCRIVPYMSFYTPDIAIGGLIPSD